MLASVTVTSDDQSAVARTKLPPVTRLCATRESIFIASLIVFRWNLLRTSNLLRTLPLHTLAILSLKLGTIMATIFLHAYTYILLMLFLGCTNFQHICSSYHEHLCPLFYRFKYTSGTIIRWCLQHTQPLTGLRYLSEVSYTWICFSWGISWET